MDDRHALRSGEVNLMDAQWTSPEAPAHEFARQDARQLELTPVNLILANGRCGTCRLRPAFVFARAYGSRNPASIEFRQPHRHELAAGHIGQSANRECTEAASAGPSIDGWLRFRAWNCTSESPIGGASSWSSR